MVMVLEPTVQLIGVHMSCCMAKAAIEAPGCLQAVSRSALNCGE